MATKNYIIGRLQELDIDFDASAKKADLFALLPEDVQESFASQEASVDEAANVAGAVANVADVYDVEGRYARTYSLDLHGDTFQDLANEFATSRGYTVKLGVQTPEPEPQPITPETGTIAEVQSNDGQVVRTYSKEVHGDDFQTLAHDFADSRGLTIVLK